jgi:hypothetical protein
MVKVPNPFVVPTLYSKKQLPPNDTPMSVTLLRYWRRV